MGNSKKGENFDADLAGGAGFDLSFDKKTGNYGKGGLSHHYYDSDYTWVQIGSGGNSGGYDSKYVNVEPGKQYQVIVGSGGPGDVASGRHYATGGTSGFVLIAYGGDI